MDELEISNGILQKDVRRNIRNHIQIQYDIGFQDFLSANYLADEVFYINYIDKYQKEQLQKLEKEVSFFDISNGEKVTDDIADQWYNEKITRDHYWYFKEFQSFLNERLQEITKDDQPQQLKPEPLDLSDTTKTEYRNMETRFDYLKFITDTFFDTLYPVEEIESEREPTEITIIFLDSDGNEKREHKTMPYREQPFELRIKTFIDKIIRKQKISERDSYVTISEFFRQCKLATEELDDYVQCDDFDTPISLKNLNSKLNGEMNSLDVYWVKRLVGIAHENIENPKQAEHDTPTVENKIIVIKEPYGKMFSNNGFELFEYLLNEHVKPKETIRRKSDLIYYYWEMYNSKTQYIHQRPATFFKWFDEKYNETTGQLKTYNDVKTPQRIKDYSTALDWFKSKNKECTVSVP
ncbi:hypothetical protein EKL99_11110 [Flavobacterium sp. ZB4P23]|uniref:hypothetical protein n=1 Tax=Flavobacterium sp. ZB4P23 TaxID=2497484 RepID=UPI000F820561|nr:hypothetical protein [Flavobacterium sp. ZB4P23]RTY81879.1 hypothetical protein EKL99_11110 [Flavobacterium sp. ZB4P23]